jgi:hypothetical protein
MVVAALDAARAEREAHIDAALTGRYDREDEEDEGEDDDAGRG